MVAPFHVVINLTCVPAFVERVAARVSRHVEILRMPFVEAIGLKLQGHHMEAVVVGKTVVGAFENPGSIGWIGMAQVR